MNGRLYARAGAADTKTEPAGMPGETQAITNQFNQLGHPATTAARAEGGHAPNSRRRAPGFPPKIAHLSPSLPAHVLPPAESSPATPATQFENRGNGYVGFRQFDVPKVGGIGYKMRKISTLSPKKWRNSLAVPQIVKKECNFYVETASRQLAAPKRTSSQL